MAMLNRQEPVCRTPDDPESQLLVADYSLPTFFDRTNASTFVLASPGTPWVRRRIHIQDPQQFAVQLEAFDGTLAVAERAGTLVLRGECRALGGNFWALGDDFFPPSGWLRTDELLVRTL